MSILGFYDAPGWTETKWTPPGGHLQSSADHGLKGGNGKVEPHSPTSADFSTRRPPRGGRAGIEGRKVGTCGPWSANWSHTPSTARSGKLNRKGWDQGSYPAGEGRGGNPQRRQRHPIRAPTQHRNNTRRRCRRGRSGSGARWSSG